MILRSFNGAVSGRQFNSQKFVCFFSNRKRLNLPLMYVYRLFRFIPLLVFFLVMEKLLMEGFVYKLFQSPTRLESKWRDGFPTYWLPLTFIQNFIDKEFLHMVRKIQQGTQPFLKMHISFPFSFKIFAKLFNFSSFPICTTSLWIFTFSSQLHRWCMCS